ncbi:MAG: ABC transporter substrate-binding protein [Ruminococcaceae bacterium]|nr:ABC transporter substrate-binding protein [Oscillospiraceae bacterium]
MKKARKLLAFLMLICTALTVALSGCSGDRADAPSEDDISNTGDAASLHVGLAKDLDDSLDPHKTVSAGTEEVLFNVFEGLVKADPQGNLIPAVAERYSVSEDGTQYTFTLREGITFHSGDPVTVEDVIYSIKRCAGLLADEPEALVTAFSVITDVRAEDEKTVVIEIESRNLEFISYLTSAIIPADYAEQDTAPMGTGPYMFVSRSAQENFKLTRYDGYWGEAPYIRDVTFKIMSQDALVTSLLSGAIDLCAHLTPAQAAEVEEKYDVITGGMNSVLGVYLNNAVEPLNDPLVRQALCHAVNVEELMALVFDGKGAPLGSSMYPAFGKYFMEELTGRYPYDPDKSRELLSQAGYPDGFSITLTASSAATQYVETAQVVAEHLKAVGVNAEIILVDWETWVSDVYGARNYEMTIVDFDASAMTARALLERFNSGHAKNISNFANPAYDAAYLRAVEAASDEEQVAAYQECQTILSDDAANIYLMDMPDMVAVRRDLTGYTLYPMFIIDLAKLQPKG